MTILKSGFRNLAALAGLLLAATPGVLQEEGQTVEIDGLLWALQTNGEDVPWAQAEAWCESLDLAGREDWRLPTLAELEAVHDPAADAAVHIRSPLPGDGCCLWSATTLEELPREEDDFYVGPGLEPGFYAWGFLYSEEGQRYYSSKSFPDGQALCVSEP